MAKRDGVFERKDCAGFWVSYVDAKGTRRKQRVHASTRTQALNVLSAIKARVQREQITGLKEIPDTTTEELFKRYLKHQKTRVTPKTVERCAAILEALRPLLPPLLKGIDRSTVAQVVDARREEAAPATVQKEITILKHALRLAVEWDWLAWNPADGVKLPKVTESRTRYLTPGELKLALTEAPEWMRGPIALAAVTGMRRGELLALKWTDVDGNRAYLRETKNGTLRVVTLNELAMQVINAQSRTHPLIFPEVDPQRLSVYTRRLFKRLGIADASFHTLRHTAASLMVMGGAGLFETGQVLGHKTPRMTARYSHLSPEHMAKAVGTLDAALKGVLDGRDAHETIAVPKPPETCLTLPKAKRSRTRMVIEDKSEIANRDRWLN